MATEAREFIPPTSADQIPQDRVFCVVQLYLTDDNTIVGGLDYKGNVLKTLGVPAAVFMNCKNAAEHLNRFTQKAVDHAAIEGKLLQELMSAFNITEADLDQDDDSTN